MTSRPSPPDTDPDAVGGHADARAGALPHHGAASRVAAAVVTTLVAVLLTASVALHDALSHAAEVAGGMLAGHAVLGPLTFAALAAVSAALAFFSSVAIVPAGVAAWGVWPTAGLLGAGWVAGGLGSYAAARWLGRPVLRHLVRLESLAPYEHLIAEDTPFGVILLFRLALPSEVPSYVLGLARYPAGKYAASLALVEVPFALGTVLAGAEFLERRVVPLAALLAAGTLAAVVAIWLLRRRLSRGALPPPRAAATGAR